MCDRNGPSRARFRGLDGGGRRRAGNAASGIIDLNTGEQPVYNEDKSVAVILNVEIYNYRELREDLDAWPQLPAANPIPSCPPSL